MATAEFPSAITTQQYRAVARLSTTLSSDITSSTTPIPVAAVTSFPAKGFITIDNETIYYNGNTTTLGSTSATRGFAGTAVAHLSGAAVKYSIVAETINIIQAEQEATQGYAGTSGGTAGWVNARKLYGKTVGQLLWSGSTATNASQLGGSTEGQLNVDLVDGVEAAAMNQLAVDQTVAAKKTYDEGCVIHAPKTYTPAGAATATLDLSLGNNHEITMPAGNITIAISNETDGQYFTIDITQDATGSRTVTWFSTIKWAGGSAPTLTTTGAKRDSFGFKVTGTDTYDAFVIGQNI